MQAHLIRMLLSWLALATVETSHSGASEIQLSPTGPINTLQAARDAARRSTKPARIIVHDGTYSMRDALTLGPEDSQVTWEAAPQAKPLFLGGTAITNWRKIEGGLWEADVSEVKDGKWHFEQLWINGRRATRARTPNKGFFHIADAAAGPDVFPGKQVTNFQAFSVAPEQYDILKQIPPDQRAAALITVTHAWAVGQCRIQLLDDSTHSVLIQGKAAYPFAQLEPDQRYWLENFRAALDAPGEWFLDRTAGKLLYQPFPDDDIRTLEAIAPVADKFLVIQGAHDVRFQGLRFHYGNYAYPSEGLHDGQASTKTDGSLEIENSRDVHFQNCEVAHVGRHAIFFKNGCSDSSVTHCRLYDLGGGGVRIGETQRPAEERVCRRITVDDCIIQHGGRLHPSACGVVMTHAQQCAVEHCDIGDLYYSGVSAGWNWGYGESLSRENRVENNHIHHLGWAYLSDMGGFYGLGTAPGTVIRGNHIHHVASHRYGGWGLYTDEGSTDVIMENNLVHDTSNSGFHQHYGYYNQVRNNIFAFGRTAQIQRTRNENRLCFIYERNIVVWDPVSPLLDGGEANWKLNDPPGRGEPRDTAIFRRNLYWPTDGAVPAKLANKWTWPEWQALGRDAGSLFADPLFVDLAHRDFRLKPNSPASRIGFKPWDLTIAGVRSDSPTGKAWRELAAQGHEYPGWATEAQPWPAPEYKIDLQTFETTPIGLIGIRNASYKSPRKGGGSIAVTDEAASPLPINGARASKRSLKIQDAPDLVNNYEPLLDIITRWEAGTVQTSFDVMGEPGADWFFEIRTHTGGEYGAGPMVSWKKGVLFAGFGDKTRLAEIPPGEWFRIAVTATTGEGAFDVTLTRQDGSTQSFRSISCKPAWDRAGYLLFSSLGTTKTALYLDNLRLAAVKSSSP